MFAIDEWEIIRPFRDDRSSPSSSSLPCSKYCVAILLRILLRNLSQLLRNMQIHRVSFYITNTTNEAEIGKKKNDGFTTSGERLNCNNVYDLL